MNNENKKTENTLSVEDRLMFELFGHVPEASEEQKELYKLQKELYALQSLTITILGCLANERGKRFDMYMTPEVDKLKEALEKLYK